MVDFWCIYLKVKINIYTIIRNISIYALNAIMVVLSLQANKGGLQKPDAF